MDVRSGAGPGSITNARDTDAIITQLEERSIDNPSLASLASLLSSLKEHDVSSTLKVGELRASGGFADVYYGQMLRTLPTTSRNDEHAHVVVSKNVAVKRIRVFVENDGDFAKTITRELRIWSGLRHRNILPLLGFTWIDKFPSLVSEWMENGTVKQYLANHRDTDIELMAKEIADGLAYLHGKEVIHSDLRADNVLVNSDGRPMLSDFGISRLRVDSVTVAGTTSLKGNVRWMACELIGPQIIPGAHDYHTKASDVWAYGMLLYELLTRKIPYHDMTNEMAVVFAIHHGQLPTKPTVPVEEYRGADVSKDKLWKICAMCWAKKPEDRPTASTLFTIDFASEFSKLLLDRSLLQIAPVLRREGDDWFAIVNPEVPGMWDVGLVHTLNHESVVCCVRFSADGKFLATGCNRTAQIYDTETGVTTCVLNDDSANTAGNFILSVCFSPDGKFLATGGWDKLIRVWDIAKQCIHQVFEGHQERVYSLDFSEDGRFIVSGSGDKTTRIWDLETSRSVTLLIAVPDGVDTDVKSVAISPDGSLVAAGGLDNVVRLWDVNTGNLVERLKGHKDSVYSIAFTPDGKGFVSGSFDKTLKHWDLTGLLCNPDRKKPLPPTTPVGPPPGSPSFDPPNPSPSAGSSTAIVPSVAAAKDGFGERGSVCTLNFTGHNGPVRSVAVSHDGRWVVSAGYDCGVIIWDLQTARPQLLLEDHKNGVISVDICSGGCLLATAGSGDGQARIWSYSVG